MNGVHIIPHPDPKEADDRLSQEQKDEVEALASIFMEEIRPASSRFDHYLIHFSVCRKGSLVCVRCGGQRRGLLAPILGGASGCQC